MNPPCTGTAVRHDTLKQRRGGSKAHCFPVCGAVARETSGSRSFQHAWPPTPGPSPQGGGESHRHFAVAHGGSGREVFGGVDDGVGVEAVMAVEVVDGAGLPEMLDAERLDAVTAHAAEPA
jgi:hypothetical protein